MRPFVETQLKGYVLPLVMAHEGGSAHGKENSLQAIRASVELGAELIEVDVRKSRDGILYCHHGSRPWGAIAATFFGLLTFSQIQKFVGTRNTLKEILDLIDLWLERRDNAQSYEHPTQKPVTLNEKPLKRCSAPGHVVLSGFAGSGSDLIACEQLNRKWRGIELDPIFATVTLDRWEAFTNQKAILL